jgi:hypothetical protein
MKSIRTQFASLAASVAVAAVLVASPAQADREPTPEERTRIEAALRAAGFLRWEEIELDDGLWEVDDAIDASGKEWDLKLDPTSMAIVERTED